MAGRTIASQALACIIPVCHYCVGFRFTGIWVGSWDLGCCRCTHVAASWISHEEKTTLAYGDRFHFVHLHLDLSLSPSLIHFFPLGWFAFSGTLNRFRKMKMLVKRGTCGTSKDRFLRFVLSKMTTNQLWESLDRCNRHANRTIPLLKISLISLCSLFRYIKVT